MADGGEILEGFLCPICKADLGSAVQLQSHFQDEHTEDQDVLRSLKDLLGKAKKKILKYDDEPVVSDPGQSSEMSDFMPGPPEFEPQELGTTRSHVQYFRSMRNKRLERYVAETNKLLIRLDKLLVDLPLDPMKRKTHEQSVVPWIDDRDVKLCANCARSFHVARRKHHCRLCGAIMCHDCTHFLELAAARKMTNPGFGHEAGSRPSSGSRSSSTSSSMFHTLRRTNSSSSLNSVLSFVDTMTGEQHFRLCVDCKELLETREKLKESRNMKPIISQFYERLQAYIAEGEQLFPMYYKMCQSLNCGETTYNFHEAQNLRVKLLRLAENIDSLSKNIAVIGTKDLEHPPRGKTLQLQQMIRLAATCYLKEQLVQLPALPTEAQLNAMRRS